MKAKQPTLNLLPWITLAGLALVVVWSALVTYRPTKLPPIAVAIDTNGVAHVLGLRLNNSKVRDFAFAALGKAGFRGKVSVQFPSGGPWTNIIATIDGAVQSGLTMSATDTPSPYE